MWCFLASESPIQPRILGPGLHEASKFPSLMNHSEDMVAKVGGVSLVKPQLSMVLSLVLAEATWRWRMAALCVTSHSCQFPGITAQETLVEHWGVYVRAPWASPEPVVRFSLLCHGCLLLHWFYPFSHTSCKTVSSYHSFYTAGVRKSPMKLDVSVEAKGDQE